MFDESFENTIQEKVDLLLSDKVFADFKITQDQKHALIDLFHCSEFCIQSCLKYPKTVKTLLESGRLTRDYSRKEFFETLQHRLDQIDSNEDLSRELRQFRYEQTIRIAWRDLVLNIDVEQTLKEISWLADACILVTLEKLTKWAVDKFGQPCDQHNHPIHLVVLAMGKLGAEELNFSSDIDLIFSYKEEGEITLEDGTISHSEFFTKLCQQFMKALAEVTAYGFVYRVDARLRPFGDSGQLALSFDAMEGYYERHGREWERYAMVKARPISLDSNAANELISALQPFVYRRYLDFGAFESLREMKRLIDAEVSRKGAENNVKLGPGGIREIEFIGQAFQLIRGGRTPELQQRGILTILACLEELNLIPEFVSSSLREAYLFLRKTENSIQAFAEQQTHSLPDYELTQLRLAFAMGFDSWTDFRVTLSNHMQTVHEHFDQIFSAPQLDSFASGKTNGNEFANIWSEATSKEESEAVLLDAGYADPKAALEKLRTLHNSSKYKTMNSIGRQRFDTLMPMLIPVVAQSEDPDTCLLRVVRLLEAIVRRTAYIALLSEHPLGLSQLVKLFDKSPWVANMLVIHPLLMDELIDPRRLYEPMYKQDLENELNYTLDIHSDDVERKIQRLIDFKQSNVLRVAASQLMEVMPVAKVSDHLTFIAETVVDAVSRMAMSDMEFRYGKPIYYEQDISYAAGFCVIAYGKLGGVELGFGSDLDLVFLHDSRGEKQITDGEKSLDNAVYYARLGQRIIHYLNTPTQSGKLYEVDMRLRPSGGSGVLVSSLKSFIDYQKNKAWTWEHQALVRARFVTGSEKLKRQFEDIRQEILCQPRNEESLLKEVNDMRIRMRNELLKTKLGEFDLKQSPGGITDIEFIIQYLILRWANNHPSIIEFTDNLRLLEVLVKNELILEDDAKMLRDAYLAYRQAVHQYALQGKNTAIASEDSFDEFRVNVTRIWCSIMGSEEQ